MSSGLSSAIRALGEEQVVAHAQAAHLAGLPWGERLRRVRGDSSHGTTSFIELALALARDCTTRSERAEEWARLAIEAARNGRTQSAEALEPLAWAVLGNVRRVRGELARSRIAFARCSALRDRIVDPLDLAETYSLEASYWCQVRELDRAAELVDQALRMSKPYAVPEVIGRYEIQAGMVACAAERWTAAVSFLLSGLDRIDPAEEPTLALRAGHNLASACAGLGLLDTAMRGILRLRRIYESHADTKLQLQRDWLVARITKARGHDIEAEVRFRQIRDGFVEHGLLAEAAMVDLERAELAATAGAWQSVEEAAARAAKALSAVGSPSEALAAVHLLAEAARKRCTSEIVLQLARDAQRLARVGRSG